MQYLIVLTVPCYPLTPRSFAVESAFAEHLKLLAEKMCPPFEHIRLAAPLMDRADFERDQHHLGRIREDDGVSFTPLYDFRASNLAFWTKAFPLGRAIWKLTGESSLVHTAISIDLARPIGFGAALAAKLQDKRSVFFVDIDFRGAAEMNYRTGAWSLKSYLLCRYLYDPLRIAQIRFATKHCSLVLLKSPRMVKAFGNGLPKVKDFFNTVHSARHVLGPEQVAARSRRLRARERPLHLVYIGRLVRYKGIDRAMEALKLARIEGARDFKLAIIGAGPERERLERISRELQLDGAVSFQSAVPYGKALFAALQAHDLMIATPVCEDTPRSVFDGLCAGVPTLAFGLSYYRDLERTGAVVTTPWLDTKAIARTICELDDDREQMAAMVRAAVQFAERNTQEIWLDRRASWTFELFSDALEGAE